MNSKTIKAKAFVNAGGIIKLPRSLIEGAAARFAGKEVNVTIEEVSERRSEDQNAYYWVAIVNPICDKWNDLGERLLPDTVHEILKYKFLRVVKMDEETAEVMVEYVRSTSNLKMFEFAFYIEDCIRFAAESLELAIEPPKKEREEFQFAIFPRLKETRETYVKRIAKYVADIFTIDDLLRYFNQNEDWETDVEIKAIFKAKKLEIKAAK